MRRARSVLIMLMMLLITSTMFSEEPATKYKIIQKSDDGRYYLDEQAVIDLANYISRLESLVANYEEQIKVYEELIQNYEATIAAYKDQVAEMEQQYKTLEKEVAKLKFSRTAWQVVAAIAVGGIIYLFVTGGE